MVGNGKAPGCATPSAPAPRAAAQRRADDVAAFAVILRFLAVERPRDVTAVLFGERDRCRRNQRDALVGRTEQHVERPLRALDGVGVVTTERAERAPGVEQSSVEKVRAQPAGFQLELAEAQHAEVQAQLDEGGGHEGILYILSIMGGMR